ncbi:hydroxyacid dehydrogenase [Rugosimonospora acidiphila]|uniref:Hydroxyacid dehydrogenase n=1 Tax=Rugosimonospora acidiphila TaxID=556531 RepID=A0ABP9SGB4_9ACTN
MTPTQPTAGPADSEADDGAGKKDPGKPLVVLRPAPQRSDRIFSVETMARLRDQFTVVDLEDDPSPAALDAWLPEAFAIVGQPDLPRARLRRAPALRALLNVEGNFFPNVDYEACFEQGIHVLGCGPAYAQPVAEYALGLALDLARGISREDRAFRAGRERYVLAGNTDSILLRHADVGLVGFGNLGRALRPLLAPFQPTVRVFDPWLPPAVLRAHDVVPATIEETLGRSQFVFVLATVTEESRQLIGAEQLDLIPEGGRLILVSRAPVVDYPALLERVDAGRLTAAIDVWPDEPVAPGDPARGLEGLVLSAHRAGGIPAAFHEVGDMVVDDLSLMARGLPPARMQVAARELVGRYRNRPVA